MIALTSIEIDTKMAEEDNDVEVLENTNRNHHTSNYLAKQKYLTFQRCDILNLCIFVEDGD